MENDAVFVELTREQILNLEVEICHLCCHCGNVGDCGRAKCMPHQRSDKKRGYFLKENK